MPAPEEPPPRLRREVVLAVLAVVALLLGVARFSVDAPAPLWVKVVDVLIAVAFVADWASRVARAAAPRRYALRNAWEAITWIPFTVLPVEGGVEVLRAARLVRTARVLRFARAAKVGVGLARLPRNLRRLGRVAEHAQLLTIGVVGVVLVTGGAAGLFALERGPNDDVRTFGDAWWWSLGMFTTVAYDVPPPATEGGRVVTGLLMVLGVAYIGVFTASLAGALLVEGRREEES